MKLPMNEHDQDGSESFSTFSKSRRPFPNAEKLNWSIGSRTPYSALTQVKPKIERDHQLANNSSRTFSTVQSWMRPTEAKQDLDEVEERKIEIEDHKIKSDDEDTRNSSGTVTAFQSSKWLFEARQEAKEEEACKIQVKDHEANGDHEDTSNSSRTVQALKWPVEVKQDAEEEEECKIEVEDHVLPNYDYEPDQQTPQSGTYKTPSNRGNPTSDAKPFACSKCSFSSAQRTSFVLHMKAAHRCSVLHFTGSGTNGTPEHLTFKYDTRALKVKCPECDYVASSKYMLHIHHKRKHDSAAKRFECTKCSYKTKLKTSLAWHVQLAHEVFECRKCDYKTDSKSSLAEHFKLQHDNSRPKAFACTVCGFSTHRKECLTRHTRLVHRDMKTYKCTMCDYATDTRRYFTQHKRRRHATAKKDEECRIKLEDQVNNDHEDTSNSLPTFATVQASMRSIKDKQDLDGEEGECKMEVEDHQVNSDARNTTNSSRTFATVQASMRSIEDNLDLDGEEEECKIEVEDHVLCKYDCEWDQQTPVTPKSCMYTTPSNESYPTSDAKAFACSKCCSSSAQSASFVLHMKAAHRCSVLHFIDSGTNATPEHLTFKYDTRALKVKCPECKYVAGSNSAAKRLVEGNIAQVCRSFILGSDLRREFSENGDPKKPATLIMKPPMNKHNEDDSELLSTYSTSRRLTFPNEEKHNLHAGTIADGSPQDAFSAVKPEIKRDHEHTTNSSQTFATVRGSIRPTEVKQDLDEVEECKIEVEDHKIKSDDEDTRDSSGTVTAFESSKWLFEATQEAKEEEECKIQVKDHEANGDREDTSNSSRTVQALKWPIEVKQDAEEEEECKIEVEDHVLPKYDYEPDQQTPKSGTHTTPSNRGNPTSDAKPFACTKCSFSSAQSASFVLHMKAAHRCSVLDFPGNMTNRSPEHLTFKCDSHILKVKCPECDYVASSKYMLRMHHKRKHDSAARIFECTKCSYKTKLKTSLAWHVELAHEAFQRAECEYKTGTKTSLAEHFNLQHNDGRPETFSCTVCGFTTQWRNVLTRHARLVHKDMTETYKCTMCDYATNIGQSFRRHKMRRHGTALLPCAQRDCAPGDKDAR